MHEELLEPLFDSLRIVLSAGNAAKLEVVGVGGEDRPSTSTEAQVRRRRLSVENQDKLIVDRPEEKDTEANQGKMSVPSTLTHQCVVNVGDVFYCVRLQELWDGELLLDITMDDPETQQHFHRILHEPQLAVLAERLVRDGALDGYEFEEDGELEEHRVAAMQVKYGLATALHRPLCKLVESNVRPVLPHPSQLNSNKAPTEAGAISLGGLFDDEASGVLIAPPREYLMRALMLNSSAYASLGWHHDREVRVIATSENILLDERAVQQVIQDILSASRENSGGSDAMQVRRQRTGARLQGLAGFSLVQTVSAHLEQCGDVAIFDVLSLTSDHGGPSYLPLVLVVEDSDVEASPLQLVFEALGIDEDCSEFAKDVLASSRTSSRADDLLDQEAQSAPP